MFRKVNEEGFAEGCFAYSNITHSCKVMKDGKYSSRSYAQLFCVDRGLDCPFYKTAEQYEEDRERSDYICRRKGIPLPYRPKD